MLLPDVRPLIDTPFVLVDSFIVSINGVTIVGEPDRTTLVDPVLVVTPVPPFATGRAVPDKVTAKVPELVIGEPEMDRKVGTVIATEVTVPEVAGAAQVGTPPATVKTFPVDPIASREFVAPDAE